MSYTIKDLISNENKSLYNEVSSQVEIELKEITSVSWTSSLNGKTGIIEFVKCNNPHAAFTHELLHLKLKINGLIIPQVNLSDKTNLDFIINELDHHRMFSEFLSLGFTSDMFLNDNDRQQVDELLNRDIPILEAHFRQQNILLNGKTILLPYLVCINPSDNSAETLEFKNRLLSIADPLFISKIDTIINNWIENKPMDYSPTLARIYKACNILDAGFSIDGTLDKAYYADNIDEV